MHIDKGEMMMNRERMEEILKSAGALKEGHFLLTSGRHSNQYMQCAEVLKYPHYTEEIAQYMAKGFEDVKVDLVIGPAMGGMIIGYELAKQLKVMNFFTERDKEGKMCLRRGFVIPEGANVVIAEDVVTTGGSVVEVIDIVKEAGANLVGVGVVVDRSNGSVDFGAKTVAAYTADIKSYEPDNCPLCESEVALVKPGSRK